MKIFQGSSLKVIDHSRKIFQLYDPLSLSSTFEHSFDLITRENFAARVAKMLIVVAKITRHSKKKEKKITLIFPQAADQKRATRRVKRRGEKSEMENI